jgi:hypothetical protein
MATTVQQKIDFLASLTLDAASQQQLEDALGSAFADSVKKAAALGGTRITKAFVEASKKASDELEDTAEAIVKTQLALANATNDAEKRRLQLEESALKRKLLRQKNMVDFEGKVHDKYVERQEEMLKAWESLKLNVRLDKAQVTKDLGEALSGAFGKVSSGDLAGLVGGLGGGLSKAGGMAEAAGLAAGGVEAGGLAAAAASLGPIIAGLGATVGVLASVAVVFQMAYDQTKKYNQALTEGAGAADFFSTGVGDMAASLNEMRDAVFDLGTRFRMDTEEIAKFTNALNASGVTYKEFGSLAAGAASQQEAFMDVTRTAIVASKSLGIEASDAAAFMDRSMRDLGKTTLPEIQGAFGMIGDAAARSGMTVKSFFTAINEATSGMALHNIRLEDTIGLMGTMADVLGEDLAKERAKLEGQFRGMGFTDRLKTIMTTGTGTTSKIVGADARAQAAAMSQPLKDAIGTLGGDIGKSLLAGGDLSIDRLGKMSEKEYRKLVVALRASGDDQAKAAARQLDNMRDLARGAARPGDLLAQADAVGQLSKAGELAMQLASASAVLGEQGISSMQGLTRAAFEQISGLSGENFEVMKRLDRELRGQFDALQERVRAGTATEEERRFAGMDFTEAVAAGFGGKEFEEGVRGGFTGMEKMTEQLLTETQSFATTLKNQIANLLEGIYSMVEYIARVMGGSKQAEALAMQSEMLKQLGKLSEESSATAGEINALVRKGATMGLSPAEKDQLAGLREKAAGLEAKKRGLQAGTESLGRSDNAAVAQALVKVAEVQASGDREAYQAVREEVQQTAAVQRATEVGVGMTVGSAVGAAAFGPAGNVLGALAGYLFSEDETSAELATGLDTLATQDSKYFTAGGKPLATLTAEQTKLLDKIAQGQRDAAKQQALQALVGQGADEAVSKYLASENKADLEVGPLMGSTDPLVQQALQQLGVDRTPPVNDFIYRGGATGGTITPINSADQLLGMKPGGPVAQAARAAPGTVVININGDTATIVRTVKDVLQKSGLTASPNNGYA